MTYRILLACLLLGSMAQTSLAYAAGQTATPTSKAPTTSTPIADPTVGVPDPSKPPPPPPPPPKPPAADGLLTLSAAKTTQKSTDAVIVELTIKAFKPINLCLNDQQPQDNVHFTISRGGYGLLNATPDVVKPSKARIKQTVLQPNQSVRWAVNVTQTSGIPPIDWQPGEYRIQAKFYPCGSANTQTPPLNSQAPLYLLLRH